MKKKAILFIDNTISFGGAMISLKNLLNALDANKYVSIVATGQSDAFLKIYFTSSYGYSLDIKLPWVHNKIYKKLINIPQLRLYPIKKIIVLIRMIYWMIAHHLPDAIKYYRIGKKHNVQIVHLNNILGSQLSGIIAAKLLGVPCVAHLRDFEEISSLTKLYARMINHHIAISSVIKDNLLELGVPEKNISIIHDSINLDEFDTKLSCDSLYDEYGVDAKTKTFGIFGRIVEWKGIREFVLAAAEVFKKIPESRAFIVGDYTEGGKNYYNEIKTLVHNLGLEKKIIFTGYRSDIARHMKLLDIIIHASITPEPFGMVVIEGMAMGKPVIAAASGGPLDIVENGKTGILIDPKNINEFADAIVNVLIKPSLAKSLGAYGRSRVERNFTNKKAATATEKIYESLAVHK